MYVYGADVVRQYDTGVKELKMIFDGQDHIHQSINAINRRLNELIGTSQQLATQIGQLAQQGAGVQQVSVKCCQSLSR